MAIPCCKNIEIVRCHKLHQNEFIENFMQKGCPVIITGAIDDWPAKQWTLDSLVEKVGTNSVHVRQNTSCEEYKILGLKGLRKNDDKTLAVLVGRQYGVRQTTFSEYVTDLKANNHRARNSYLAVQNIKKALPELQEYFRIPEYVDKVHGGPYLWIANAGHYEYCHFDPDDGLLIILDGSKQVRLFSPESLDRLYPNRFGTKGRTIQSQVNCDEPNLEQHPLFNGVTCHHGLVNQGEMLYIPAFWWHQVTTLNVSISVNIFWGDAGTNNYLTKVMALPVWPSFRHWLCNIVEQNRDCESFKRTLSRMREALRDFIMTQWHESISEDQMSVLLDTIRDYLQLTEIPQDINTEAKYPPRLRIRGLLWRS